MLESEFGKLLVRRQATERSLLAEIGDVCWGS